VKHLDTITVSKSVRVLFQSGGAICPACRRGGIVEVRPLRDGQDSILFTPEFAQQTRGFRQTAAQAIFPLPMAVACTPALSVAI